MHSGKYALSFRVYCKCKKLDGLFHVAIAVVIVVIIISLGFCGHAPLCKAIYFQSNVSLIRHINCSISGHYLAKSSLNSLNSMVYYRALYSLVLTYSYLLQIFTLSGLAGHKVNSKHIRINM